MFSHLAALACACSLAFPTHAAKRRALPQTGESGRYVCTDGRTLDVLYGGGVAVLTIGGGAVELARDPSPDRESYSGGGWTWQVTAGRTGKLAPLTSGQAAAGVSCRAA